MVIPNRQAPATRNGRSAFTMLEVLVATIIASIMVLGIAMLMNFNFLYQDQQEIRANAMDAMSREMENIRKHFVFRDDVGPHTITVTDYRTPDKTSDDTTAMLTVRIFNRQGLELSSPPSTSDVHRVVMTVQWRGRGGMQRRMFQETLVGTVIP